MVLLCMGILADGVYLGVWRVVVRSEECTKWRQSVSAVKMGTCDLVAVVFVGCGLSCSRTAS